MLEKLFEKLRTFRQTSVIMGAAGATTLLAESNTIEWLPKGPVSLIVGTGASLLLFYVKRDYNRINAALERQEARQLAAEGKSLDDKHAMTIAFAERSTAMENRQQIDKRDLMFMVGNCVKVTEMSRSLNGVFNRINKESLRTTIIETKLGMHDSVHPATHDDEPTPELMDDDPTPPYGRPVK